jgi:uncharacterized repeat protein (TIGR01451 family)
MRKMEDSMRLIKLAHLGQELALNGQRRAILASLFLSGLLFLMLAPVLLAEETAVEAVLTVAKNVDRQEAIPGSILQYNIALTYTGPFTPVNVVDTLPTGLTYQPNSLTVSGGGSFGESGGVITWTGAVNSGAMISISFRGVLDGNLEAGTLVTNTVEATAIETGQLLPSSAATLILAEPVTKTVHLPLVVKPYPEPEMVTLNPIGQPNSSNHWSISWSGGGSYVTGYQLHESHTADFAVFTTYEYTQTTAVQAQHPLTFRNVYYYRVRATGPGGAGPWSGTQSVVGGYRDNFDDSSSGWLIRRTTHIDDVQSWYESYNNGQGHRLIMKVEDPFDWGITSPLMPAPRVPYAIEYRAEPAQLGDRISHGAVFGGDWNGEPCPDWSTVPGVYQHTRCFNHFYNTNTIWFGTLRVLFERVDSLVWCPACGGSAMKRITNDPDPGFASDLTNVNHNGANTYRIEVRSNGIKFFANDTQYGSTPDTTWINSPYFGIFASTNAFSNSTWRIEYFEVKPLDQ